MTTTASDVQASLTQMETDIGLLHDIVNGDASTSVTTEAGSVASLAKVLQQVANSAPARGYDTEANLLADTAPDEHVVGYALDTEKYYVKTAAAGTAGWATGPTSNVEALKRAAQMQVVGFYLPIIVDTDGGLYGAGEGVLMPRGFFFKSANYTNVNGTFGTAAGTGLLADYTLIATTSSAFLIYADLTDTAAPYKVFDFNGETDPPAFSESLIPVVITWAGKIRWSPFWCLNADGTDGTAMVDVANGPIIHDVSENVLLVPTLQGHDGLGNTFFMDVGSSGAIFREVTIPTGSAAGVSVWVDVKDISVNGNTSDAALRSDTSWPPRVKNSAPMAAILGYGFAGRFMARFGQQIEYLRNECPYTADDNDKAEFFFSTTVAQDNTDSGAASTYPRGWADPTNNRPYYGGRFQKPLHAGWVFVRLHVTTPTAGSFGSPVAYLLDADLNTTAFGGLQIEKVVSTTHRIYCGWFYRDQSTTPMVGLWAGVDSAPTGVMIFGLQYAVGSTRNIWVNRVDAPRYGELPGDRLLALERTANLLSGDFDPLPPRTLAGISGLTLPFYPGQCFGNSVEGRYSVSLVSNQGSSVSLYTQKAEGGSLRIAPIQSGTDFIYFRDKSLSTPSIWSSSVTTRVAPKTSVAGLSPRVHFLGDSLRSSPGRPISPSPGWPRSPAWRRAWSAR